MLAGAGQPIGGSAGPLKTSPQLTNMLVLPYDMSARNSVQTPFGFELVKEFRRVERGVVSSTKAGSTSRPSGCQAPVTGVPGGGFVKVS